MKKILLSTTILLLGFVAFPKNANGNPTAPSVADEGVVINGIRWATRNVDAPGTFVANPEDAGMLYQWNRSQAWNVIDEEVGNWDNRWATGTEWVAQNNPCPTGWRIPTREELQSLRDIDSEWTVLNGVSGRLFGTAPNQIFLPAAGWRNTTGILNSVGISGVFWSNTPDTGARAAILQIGTGRNGILWGGRANGYSVRCVAEF